MKNNFTRFLNFYMDIKKFEIAHIAHITFLLGSAVLESYI